MRESVPSLEWKVAEVIERCAGASVVFSRFRMACVGCVMAPLREFRRACRGNAARR